MYNMVQQMLNRTSSMPENSTQIPRYQIVKDHMLALIKNGAWPRDKRLPSESELVAELKVSRMTVNRALRELSKEGFIKRLSGVGSFVNDAVDDKVQSHPLAIRNIAADIEDRGHDYSCKVMSIDHVRADADIAKTFDISPGSRLFYSEIIHYESNLPIQIEQRHVLPAFAPEYLAQNFNSLSTTEYLLQQPGTIEEIEQIVQACMPSQKQIQQLQLVNNEPCLLLLRRTWVDSIVVTSTKLYHPASRYQFGSRYKP